MKAQNLTISIPSSVKQRCNKNCPYCVSKMTVPMEQNKVLFLRNLRKVLTIAKSSNVNSVLITGKGEPTLSPWYLMRIIRTFSDFPIELQTNGIVLDKDRKLATQLFERGLDTVAFSIDNLKTLEKYKNLFEYLKSFGMNVRVCFNVSNLLTKDLTYGVEFGDIFWAVKRIGNIDQILFRNITQPTVIADSNESRKTAKWITENEDMDAYHRMFSHMEEIGPSVVRELPFGMKVYDLNGIGITFSDYCIQDSNGDSDIRSLIYQEDGHLYTSWNSKASRIF